MPLWAGGIPAQPIMKPEANYCRGCGSPLKDVVLPCIFDTKTGEPVTERVCLKYGCKWNKLCLGRAHSYGFLGFGRYCRYCGWDSY